MYSIAGYGTMIADRIRMDAYREALRRAIHPGSVVVDLGAGPGIMSCLAVQFGAAQVYAIDPSETLEVGRTIARMNNMDGRIQFLRKRSQEVTLPKPADVVVADLRGVLPAFAENFRTIADARERLLKPDGVLIPRRDTLWAALAEAPHDYDDLTSGWSCDGLDLSAGRRMVVNTWKKSHLAAGQLLSDPAQWAEVDYGSVYSPALSGHLVAGVQRVGTAHGVSAWFDTVLLEDVGFSNAPGQPETIYGQAFFPLVEPVSVETGDQVRISLRADQVAGDYTWTWNTCIRMPVGTVKAEYKQCTFFGIPLSTDILRKRADTFVPAPTPDALVDGAILDMFRTCRTLREISEDVAARFPSRFSDWKAALDRVAALSVRYST
jgi:protein arginine N-methyltransferase 1